MPKIKQPMWAVFRNNKHKYPDIIVLDKRSAELESLNMKNYWWGKKSYIKRISVDMTNDTVWKVSNYEYKTIKS